MFSCFSELTAPIFFRLINSICCENKTMLSRELRKYRKQGISNWIETNYIIILLISPYLRPSFTWKNLTMVREKRVGGKN